MSTPDHLCLLESAEGLAHREDYAEAVRLCDQVLARDPEDAAALNLKGYCLASAGRPAEALPFFQSARRQLPVYAPIRYNLGQALAATGDLRGALSEYEEALRLDGGHIAAHGARGVLRAELGDLAGALGDFDELVRREPENARAYLLRGGCHLTAKRFPQAKADLETAGRLDPSLWSAIDGLVAGVLALDPQDEG
jgi:tetratricopeptide (TPR) repeat protein